MTPDDPASPTKLSISLFGSQQLPDTAADPFGFYGLWSRLCCRLVVKSAVGPVLQEDVDTHYPMLGDLAIPVKRDELTKMMWRFDSPPGDRIRIAFLDLNTAGIHEQEFPAEDSRSLLALQLPICSRDPVISGYRGSGRLPIPKCGLRMKWAIVEQFAQAYPGAKAVLPLSWRERGDGRIWVKAEQELERKWAADWALHRDRLLLGWLSHFRLNSSV
jgi:hypothetical protein